MPRSMSWHIAWHIGRHGARHIGWHIERHSRWHIVEIATLLDWHMGWHIPWHMGWHMSSGRDASRRLGPGSHATVGALCARLCDSKASGGVCPADVDCGAVNRRTRDGLSVELWMVVRHLGAVGCRCLDGRGVSVGWRRLGCELVAGRPRWGACYAYG